MRFKFSKGFVTAFKIVLSLSALAFVISKIEIKEVLNLYLRSDALMLLLALVLFALSKTIAAFRLNIFLRFAGVFINHLYNLKLYLLGMFYNLFLPGGIGGDGYKIYLLSKKHDVKTGRIFWAVFTDRVSGMLALFILAVVLMYFIDLETSFSYKNYVWLLIPLALTASYILLSKLLPWLRKAFNKTTAMSFGVQVVQTVSAFFILRAIGGSSGTAEYLFIFLISSIVAMLPISIGGVGMRELTFLYGSGILGLDQNISIALSLMFYLITMIVSFAGIYYSINGKTFEKEK